MAFRSRELGLKHVFVNKLGEPIEPHGWAKDNWGIPLDGAPVTQKQKALLKKGRELPAKIGIRFRKFYATRHTFITEAIKRGENLLAVAQYCGTSLAMIQADYCGSLTLDATKMPHTAEKQLDLLVVPTGFEPVLPT